MMVIVIVFAKKMYIISLCRSHTADLLNMV